MKKAAPREKILEAALSVFAQKGYHRAIVDDIVRVSGTSKGAVYHHFPNKEALFLALVDEFASHLAAAAAEAIAAQHGALKKVEGALRAALETFARYRQLARILLLESVSLGPTYETKRAEGHRRFADLIKGYLDEPVAVPGPINEVVIQWLHPGRPDLVAEALPSLTRLLLRSIGGEAPRP